MSTFEILLSANLVFLIGLAGWQFRIRHSLKNMDLAASTEKVAENLPQNLIEEIRKGQPVLAIHVLNPMELATEKHWLAGVAGRITPGIVRRIVASEAARIAQIELQKYGVKANVEILRDRR